jgi:hypothetical protein
MLVPAYRNNAGLDALVWSPVLIHHVPVDATISERLGLHQTGALAVVKALGWTETDGWPVDFGGGSGIVNEQNTDNRDSPASGGQTKTSVKQQPNMRISYYWAVPHDSFHEGWVTRQAAKKGSEEAAFERHVVQYAISISSQLVVKVAVTALEGVPTPEELLSESTNLKKVAAMQ